jgi:hypothetical protein
MSYNDINTYFGDTARTLFNQRCQTMNRQSKIVASSRKERIISTYFIDKEKEVHRNESRARRAQSLDTMKNKNKKTAVILAPLEPKKKFISSQSEKMKPFIIPKVSNQILKSESQPTISDVNLEDRKSRKRSALYVPRKNEDDSDDDDDDADDGGGDPIRRGQSFDGLSCFTLEERSLNDDDDSVSSSVDSQDDLMTLSNIADNGYKHEIVAQPLTPRTRFISACIREGLNPRASLVIRRHMSTHLKLSHFAIGDKVACILASSLFDLPEIESIDISNNVLTDISLEPLLMAIGNIHGLTELNLSSNIIGPRAAKAISEYLSSPSCPLQKLVLQNADVDDYECERFIAAILNNSTLVDIDLSNNQIGSAEALNVVKPDLITGGSIYICMCIYESVYV